MLGIDENKSLLTFLIGSKPGLVSNLVQIGTGEGKSITLAVASCVLALLGFDVSCASLHFEPLFNAFGVVDHIHYGTFNKLCERIINEGGDVRKLVENLIIPDDEKKECGNTMWDKLLDEAIKDMLSDVQTFKSHGYQVSNNKIG
ncbi:hypothetical protein RFI_37433 [Reticulomyxa filosa]|uniref:SecA DEAD-like N-terminal domain-containing protein n=1 Tax=Reticulomyxa filosa TaxID=46433 RepID=X6LF87_RETFI|nr:hypothetical protein RFI_37433 [Reticulomyxa filosa]|eukprot:ETO00026.1 hypothetical protein RFI_37433 [Reticulomyxa filosa]